MRLDEVVKVQTMHDELMDEIAHLQAKIADLEAEVTLWKDRYEAANRDHEATIHHAEEMMRELHNAR